MQEDKLRWSYLSWWQGALTPDKLLPPDRHAPELHTGECSQSYSGDRSDSQARGSLQAADVYHC